MKNYIEEIKDEITESLSIKELIIRDKNILTQIQEMIEICINTLSNKNKIIFAGNGGSFSDAQHLSTEFVSRFRFDRRALSSIVLGTNSSSMSAIGNDYGFENIFARELEGVAQKGDLFIPISTSGNSKNILQAVICANKMKIQTFCLTGETGGSLINLCKCICVPSKDTARIQESHILIGHIVCGIVEKYFLKVV